MPHTTGLFAACALFGLSIAGTVVSQTALPKPELWLLQSVHLAGDQVEGFKKTCLIVYPNGEYHRERRRQVSRGGRAQFDWEAPEVFEAKLTRDDLNVLEAILETPEFSSIKGAVGDSRNLLSKLMINLQGAVAPHEIVEIVTVAVARSAAPQIFEVADIDFARRQEPLRAFLNWIKSTERSQAQRFAASKANNCSSLIATSNTSVGGAPLAMGVTYPKAIYAPDPQPPHDTPKPQPVMVELLINPDGSVAQASLLDHHPNPDIARSVLDAVRKWKFDPARLLGVPIAKTIRLRVEFENK